jgi:acyl-homoserine lactone acylase PvdQ
MYFYSLADPSRLRAGDVYWDDPATPEEETMYQVIEDCFDEAGRLLMDDLGLGDDETEWAWGRAQGLVLSSDLSAFGIPTYNNPPPGESLFANPGGVVTVSPTNPAWEGSGFVQRGGAVARRVCEALPSGPKCTIELPGGQSGDIDSPNYEDLLFKYLDGEPIDFVFDIEEAKANAVRTVTFD